jgi:hypothetical protein
MSTEAERRRNKIRSLANAYMKQHKYIYAVAPLSTFKNHFHFYALRGHPTITKTHVNNALTNNWFKQYKV